MAAVQQQQQAAALPTAEDMNGGRDEHPKPPLPKKASLVHVARPVRGGSASSSTASDLQRTLPRHDSRGRIVEHAFLGSLADYNAVAETAVAERERKLAHPPRPPNQPRPANARTQRTLQQIKKFEWEARQTRSLKNWEQTTKMWNETSKRLARKLGKDQGSLAMQSPDSFRATAETREVVDQAIPKVGNGKGLGYGAEFWRTPEAKRDVPMSLTMTERGMRRDLEFISKPNSVRRELCQPLDQSPTPRWGENSKYLQERQNELGGVIGDLVGHTPDFGALEVIGRRSFQAPPSVIAEESSSIASGGEHQERTASTPALELQRLQHQPQCIPYLTTGPNLVFSVAGSAQPMRMDGCRVAVTAVANQRSAVDLVVRNTGTCCVHYSWVAVPKANPLGVSEDHRPHFFFNRSQGMVLPGAELTLPITFFSATHGLFSESWQLVCKPELSKPPIIHLSAIATAEDPNADARQALEAQLARRILEEDMRALVLRVIERVRTPPPQPTAMDEKQSKNDLFCAANPNLAVEYAEEGYAALETLFREAWRAPPPAAEEAPLPPATPKAKTKEKPAAAAAATAAADAPSAPPEEEPPAWDQSIDGLRELILSNPNWSAQEEMLATLNDIVASMSAPPPRLPISVSRHDAARECVVRFLDTLVDRALEVHSAFGVAAPACNPPEDASPEAIMNELSRTDAKDGRKSGRRPSAKSATAKPDKRAKGSARAKGSETKVAAEPAETTDSSETGESEAVPASAVSAATRQRMQDEIAIRGRDALRSSLDELFGVIAELPPMATINIF